MKIGDICPTCEQPSMDLIAYSVVKTNKKGKPDGKGEELVYGCSRTKPAECTQEKIVVRRKNNDRVPSHLLNQRL